jgi:hypothetical protein
MARRIAPAKDDGSAEDAPNLLFLRGHIHPSGAISSTSARQRLAA